MLFVVVWSAKGPVGSDGVGPDLYIQSRPSFSLGARIKVDADLALSAVDTVLPYSSVYRCVSCALQSVDHGTGPVQVPLGTHSASRYPASQVSGHGAMRHSPVTVSTHAAEAIKATHLTWRGGGMRLITVWQQFCVYAPRMQFTRPFQHTTLQKSERCLT